MIERGNIYQVFVKGMSYPVEILRPKEEMPLPIKEEEEVPPSREEVVSTPMTCQVIKILVKTGEIVESDEELFVVEAMKLEMPIPSPIRGRVKEVLVKEGQTIDTGTKLLTLTPLSGGFLSIVFLSIQEISHSSALPRFMSSRHINPHP